MMYIMNSPNHLKHLKILEYYHKDIDKKLPTMFITHFSRKEKKYGKRSLGEQVEPNLNKSEEENQRGRISNSL